MINQKNLESGRSMIEMLGVLAIIGVLSVGGIAGYSKAMLKYKTNKAIDEITQLSSNIRIAFGNSKDYADLNGNVINAFNIMPSEMYNVKDTTNGDNTYQTPWGTDVYIAPSQRTEKDGLHKRAFTIVFKDIPSSACSELALVDWGGTSGGSGLIAMKLSSTSITDATTLDNQWEDNCVGDGSGLHCVVNPKQTAADDGSKGFPVSPGNAVTHCGTSGLSSIAWKFY